MSPRPSKPTSSVKSPAGKPAAAKPKAVRALPSAAKKKPAAPKPVRAAAKMAVAIPVPEDKSVTNGAELSAEVLEFVTAIDEYKRKRNRKFPSWTEILEIVKALGYQRSA